MRSNPFPTLGLVLAVFATAGCPASAETGTVVGVVDGDTIKVSLEGRVRTVRLLGIDTPEPAREDRVAEPWADRATAFTRTLVEGRTVELETDPKADAEDKYGRALRYVFLPDGRLLNATIVAEGHGQVYTRFPCSRLAQLRQLERAARESGRGMWNPEGITRIAPEDAASSIGAIVTVCGLVASTRHAERSAGSPTFLNLGRPHPDQPLAVVIWGTVRNEFEKPEARYADRRVCVTGRIRDYRGKPEIVVSDPSEITIDPPPRR